MRQIEAAGALSCRRCIAAAPDLLNDLNVAVIVAVPVVLVMKMAIHKVVGMIAVRDGLVPTVCFMLVIRIVAVADMAVSAGVRVGLADGDDVLVHVSLVEPVQMPFVQVVDVALMLDGGVTAVDAMLVDVVLVNCVVDCHNGCLSKARLRPVRWTV